MDKDDPEEDVEPGVGVAGVRRSRQIFSIEIEKTLIFEEIERVIDEQYMYPKIFPISPFSPFPPHLSINFIFRRFVWVRPFLY